MPLHRGLTGVKAAVMDERCAECGYDYGSVRAADAPGQIRSAVDELVTVLSGADPAALARTPSGTWSVLEYAGHVRDVLVVQRERVLMARSKAGQATRPMARDERVRWGEYADCTAEQLRVELALVAAWLAHTLELLSEEDWSRTLVYNYPEPAERSLEWLATHTVHELVHHRHDVTRLLSA
jgi:hypothetical protein